MRSRGYKSKRRGQRVSNLTAAIRMVSEHRGHAAWWRRLSVETTIDKLLAAKAGG